MLFLKVIIDRLWFCFFILTSLVFFVGGYCQRTGWFTTSTRISVFVILAFIFHYFSAGAFACSGYNSLFFMTFYLGSLFFKLVVYR